MEVVVESSIVDGGSSIKFAEFWLDAPGVRRREGRA